MEWRPAGWSVCLPRFIFPCAIRSRRLLLAPAYQDSPGKRAVKWWYVCVRLESWKGDNVGQSQAIRIMLLVSETQLTNSPLKWWRTAERSPVQLRDEMTHEVMLVLCLAERTAHETFLVFLTVLQPAKHFPYVTTPDLLEHHVRSEIT